MASLRHGLTGVYHQERKMGLASSGRDEEEEGEDVYVDEQQEEEDDIELAEMKGRRVGSESESDSECGGGYRDDEEECMGKDGYDRAVGEKWADERRKRRRRRASASSSACMGFCFFFFFCFCFFCFFFFFFFFQCPVGLSVSSLSPSHPPFSPTCG